MHWEERSFNINKKMSATSIVLPHKINYTRFQKLVDLCTLCIQCDSAIGPFHVKSTRSLTRPSWISMKFTVLFLPRKWFQEKEKKKIQIFRPLTVICDKFMKRKNFEKLCSGIYKNAYFSAPLREKEFC